MNYTDQVLAKINKNEFIYKAFHYTIPYVRILIEYDRWYAICIHKDKTVDKRKFKSSYAAYHIVERYTYGVEDDEFFNLNMVSTVPDIVLKDNINKIILCLDEVLRFSTNQISFDIRIKLY